MCHTSWRGVLVFGALPADTRVWAFSPGPPEPSADPEQERPPKIARLWQYIEERITYDPWLENLAKVIVCGPRRSRPCGISATAKDSLCRPRAGGCPFGSHLKVLIALASASPHGFHSSALRLGSFRTRSKFATEDACRSRVKWRKKPEEDRLKGMLEPLQSLSLFYVWRHPMSWTSRSPLARQRGPCHVDRVSSTRVRKPRGENPAGRGRELF